MVDTEKIKCHKCKGFVSKLGGLRNYNDKDYCVECYDKAKEKEKTKLNQLSFIGKHWEKWIVLGIVVIAVLFAVFT